VELGIDIVDDGEFGKTLWMWYVLDRLDGIGAYFFSPIVAQPVVTGLSPTGPRASTAISRTCGKRPRATTSPRPSCRSSPRRASRSVSRMSITPPATI
jgi:hypothetical protein